MQTLNNDSIKTIYTLGHFCLHKNMLSNIINLAGRSVASAIIVNICILFENLGLRSHYERDPRFLNQMFTNMQNHVKHDFTIHTHALSFTAQYTFQQEHSICII